ncbi:hypothetical protein PS6_005977 [Mucor atramentarius]
MDNNPFRSHQPQTGNYMTPTMGGQQQQQQPQQQQPPYQSNYSMGSGYSTPQNGYQQQQPWQYQQPQTSVMSPATPQQSNFASTLPQQNSFTSSLPSTTTAGPPPSQFSPYSTHASLMSSTATSNVSTPSQMNAFGAGGNTYQPYSMPTPNTGNVNYPNNNSMMFNNPGYQQPYQQQQQQQQHDPSNFYIPPNFGMSTTTTTANNNTMFQPQQPRHAPVDASSLLKGTQVRRVECPVCQKMIEGDDMAVNHHDVCDEENIQMKVPPPSPQDASMLEAVFSQHLSAKIHAVVNPSHDSAQEHAQTLERLLLTHRKPTLKRHTYHKRPSRIPVLSSRIIHKKNKRLSMQQDALANALEKVHISHHHQMAGGAKKNSATTKPYLNGLVTMVMNKSEKNDCSVQETIIQDIKDMAI